MTRISRVHYPVTSLGPGKRLGVWFQGCSLGCKGCMSRDTWDSAAGTDVPVATLAGLWREAVADGADGLTVSGGEPFDQPGDLVALLTQAAALRAGRDADVLVYTGYELAEAERRAPGVRALADVLITGRYEAGKPTRLIWRGSANQEMHLLSPLGRRRYARYTGHVPDRPPIQLVADDQRIWLVGVPPPGGLRDFERGLRQREVSLDGPSWRP